ncbi:maleylpyruvate isomerase family mycothiol-dependent enzyme [Mycobacterium deserti]|uniref:Maleylpyruvate isomerase family mycothiol-dependent enzyme n=1 Tax=Mycobacterium deserti TaxID=2978347 RepID=A0ABT2MAY0_9MYCO|nr:maleylpyruvate isomerase family mycothiol-dependent enzyme [Mycobacterium deserti]MCT7658734.1 maleylpyruvate isomerase family mycothiol-dependent enzyme [Mycobacterium deserti]
MDFRAALLDQTRSFGDLIRSADSSLPVPTCPDWTLKQLFRHVGRGNRWAAQIIADRRSEALDPREVRDGKPPDDPDGAIDWLNEGAQLIVDAVDRVGSARVWTFLGPRPAGWWIRRRLHEVTVHTADAALAVGHAYDLSPELAADAISEWVELMAIERTAPPPLERGHTMHLHATDGRLGPTGEWTIVHDDDGVWWSHQHGKGDVAVRGTAGDLLLAITRRRTADELGLEMFGDGTVWNAWLERTQF